MRVVAILASHNEAVYVRACLDSYIAQGVEVYLIDNDSTDRTVEIARTYLGRGLLGIERFPREGRFALLPMLRRKEEIADAIRADWYIHADMDEIRLPPRGQGTLARALREVDRAGYNTVNFRNFLFMPPREEPDHFHARFVETMRWYRYMEPSYPNQVKGWKRQKHFSIGERLRGRLFGPGRPTGPRSVDLAATGGHKVDFPGARLCPDDFILKHYPVLSLDHAVRKYVEKTYAETEVSVGFHGWKARAAAPDLRLPSVAELRTFTGDAALDISDPITRTLIYAASA